MKLLPLCVLSWLLVSTLVAEELELWNDGRITPEQPFRARVVGSVSAWGGAVVLLKEEGKEGRYCVANLIMQMFYYRVVDAKDFDRDQWIKKGATFIEPSVEVDRFSWSMGVHRIGRIFGADDFVRQWYERSKPEPGSPLFRVIVPQR